MHWEGKAVGAQIRCEVSNVGFAIWVYVQKPGGGFSKVSMAAYDAFHSGEAPLRGISGREAIVAELLVKLENRKPSRLRNHWYRRFRLTANGRRDPKASAEEASLTNELVEAAHAEGGVIGNLTSAQGQLLQRRLAVRFRWEPTAAELDTLSQIVNRRAKCHLIGPAKLRVVK